MQLFIAIAALFAGLALAQDLSAINALPACGKTCINNMLGKATSLGCPANNITCLCTNMDFGNGVRDCSAGLCPSTGVTDTSSIIAAGDAFCEQAIAAANSGSTTATVVQTELTGATTATVLTAASAVTGVITTTDSMGSTTTSTIGAGSTGSVMGGSTNSTSGGLMSSSNSTTSGSSSNSTSSGTNGTNMAGGTVMTTTNSLGSTILTTMASSTSGSSPSSTSGSSSGSSSTTSSASAPTSSKKSDAGHMVVVGYLGVAGMAALALL